MEGNIYKATWRKAGREFEIWLLDAPEIRSTANNFEDAEEELLTKICVSVGDGEAVLEFDSPPVHRSRSITTDGFVMLTAKEQVEARKVKVLFTGAVCTTCGSPRGTRNDVRLRLAASPKSNIAIVSNSRTRIKVFSESLLRLLSNSGLPNLSSRPVEIAGESKEPYYELAGPETVRYVSIRGADLLPAGSRKCPECSYVAFIPVGKMVPPGIHFFICGDDVQAGQQSFLAGFYPNQFDLCLSSELWQGIKREGGARGIVAERLGVVDAKSAQRTPPVPFISGSRQ